MTTPPSEIIEAHRQLVAILISLEQTGSDRANEIRAIIQRWNKCYPILEQVYIKMMSDKLLQGV